MQRHPSLRLLKASLATVLVAASAAVWAVQPKQSDTPLESQAFALPELYISSQDVPLADVLDRLPNRAAWQARLARNAGAGQEWTVFVNPRSGAVTNLLASFPLIPGNGLKNNITSDALAASLGRNVTQVDATAVADAVRRFAEFHKELLGIDTAQLGELHATQVNDELWQVSGSQQVNGIPVRWGRVLASISHGNLVTMGTETWADATIDTLPAFGGEKALELAFETVGGRSLQDVIEQKPLLTIVPIAPQEFQSGEAFAGPVGQGLAHRLAYSIVFTRPPALAVWELLIDAHTGQMLSLEDTNHYVTRQVTGGVYPLTDTGQCPDATRCGTMQSGYPMPFANTGLASPNNFSNSAGNFNWTSGNVTTTLNGRNIRIVDTCGSISETSATGNLNLGGTNNQHDCTSAGASAGDTPASRSGFYELNKLAEQARGWLPNNTWLQGQLTSNMNLNQTCNAFWSPSAGTVNFYRSGGGCRNTGEIAAVFDHEWGHGMDDNDAAGALSNSSEAYADIAAIYRLQASCVGYGFFQTVNSGCGQTSDGTGFNTDEALTGATYCATDCSGVRDTDFAKHSPATAATPLGFVCGQCTTGTGPCGRQVHCSAAPVRQAAWDLVARDLTAAPFSYDSQSAFIVGNKLFYQGSGNIGAWHSCTCGGTATGCASANGYMQWLTADDDNGNLNDGTPHMTAIFNAYNRHGIACSTPTAQNSGCSAGPSAAPTLTVTPGDSQASLSWTAVTGATRYWVFRGEGQAGCAMGKALIATVTGATTYTDTQVANGRTYYYTVVAAGASAACYGRAATCTSVTPVAGTTPDFSLACSPSSLTVQQGNNGASTCTVTSTGGFASAVGLDCTGAPAGVTCAYVPSSVTPPANGSGASALTIAVAASTTPGSYSFQARGTNGSTTRTANISLTVTTAPVPNFSVACSPSSLTVPQGGSGASTCTISSTNGFASGVSLACASLPAGATCSFTPASVTPPANGSTTSALTVNVAASTTTGTFAFTVNGTSGATSHSASMSLIVTGTGGTVFTDDFETNKGWTTNPNGTDTATTGAWERGDPEATTSGVALQLGTTVSGVNDLVTARLAGAAAGTNDVDGGTTSIQSPLITLPSTGTLTLTFRYYLAHLNNATSADFFRASVVSGATVTQVFQSVGAASNRAGAWTLVTVNLSSFAGQSIRLRFEAADAATASLIEAGVDDVTIAQP